MTESISVNQSPQRLRSDDDHKYLMSVHSLDDFKCRSDWQGDFVYLFEQIIILMMQKIATVLAKK